MLKMLIWFLICLDFFEWFHMMRLLKRQRKYIEYHKKRSFYLSKNYDNGKMPYREAIEWLKFDAKINCFDAMTNHELTPAKLKETNEHKYNIYLAEITAANALLEAYERGFEIYDEL